jgi:hypothetical protein
MLAHDVIATIPTVIDECGLVGNLRCFRFGNKDDDVTRICDGVTDAYIRLL